MDSSYAKTYTSGTLPLVSHLIRAGGFGSTTANKHSGDIAGGSGDSERSGADIAGGGVYRGTIHFPGDFVRNHA